MSEDVARAVGAGGTTVKIAGKECTVRPLGIRELAEVQRDCVSRYKRQYLQSFSENLDLLPEAVREREMDQKIDMVSRWDIDDLPAKYVHDSRRIKLTAELRDWVCENVAEDSRNTDDDQMKRMVAVSLDQSMLSPDDYKRLSGGSLPPKLKVPYVNWWITGCFDGMVTFVWVCFRRDGITRDQVVEELGENINKLLEVTHEIERLSTPSGNG